MLQRMQQEAGKIQKAIICHKDRRSQSTILYNKIWQSYGTGVGVL